MIDPLFNQSKSALTDKGGDWELTYWTPNLSSGYRQKPLLVYTVSVCSWIMTMMSINILFDYKYTIDHYMDYSQLDKYQRLITYSSMKLKA